MDSPSLAWSKDLSVPGEALPEWMLELAEQVKLIEPGALLPTGVIVGSAVVERVEEVASCGLLVASEGPRFRSAPVLPSRDAQRAKGNSQLPSLTYAWHLCDVRRAKRLRPPARRPQPVWFLPF